MGFLYAGGNGPDSGAQRLEPGGGILSPLQRLHQCRADHHTVDVPGETLDLRAAADAEAGAHRSEEHTSELQSRLHLVCRLLLEKKKNRILLLEIDSYE